MTVIVHQHNQKVDINSILQKYYPEREHMGRGSYAEVWRWKDGVVKRQCYGNAYGDYLRWMIKNQDNPYVPRLYRVDLWEKEKGMVIVYMEKLKRVYDVGHSDTYDEIRNFITCENLSFFLRMPESHRPHLTKLRKDILRMGKMHCLDLHAENIMMRKVDDTYLPVLTDPIA